MIIIVGNKLELAKKLVDLGYSFPGSSSFDTIIRNAYKEVGDSLCISVGHCLNDKTILHCSKSFYERENPDEEFVTIEEFLMKNNMLNSEKYIVVKLAENKFSVHVLNGQYYEPISKCFPLEWKEYSWAEAELKTRIKMDNENESV